MLLKVEIVLVVAYAITQQEYAVAFMVITDNDVNTRPFSDSLVLEDITLFYFEIEKSELEH